MRKLASIQRIVSLSAIENADKILKCGVLGWECVVAKSDGFNVGDLVCYIEVDSILPQKPEFEFLRERKFRVRTIRLRGQVSQGIVFPLSILPKGEYNEDDDVTDILGVKKYDPQAVLEQKEADRIAQITKNKFKKFFMRYPWYRRLVFKPTRLPFPPWIKKTDEDRIQLFPSICEDHKDTVFQVTEKLDGTSATYFVIKNNAKWQFWKPYLFGVCSRNFQLVKVDDQPYWSIAKSLRIKDRLIEFAKRYDRDSMVLQGEIIGTKIQGNKYHRSEQELYLFNIIMYGCTYDNIMGKQWADWNDFNFVPIVNNHFILPSTIAEMVELAKGNSELGADLREGLVLRNYEKNISFKVINPDFLLKYDE